ncbi:MAG: universal stress protein [Dehalococcoidia bacterium]
MSESSIVVPLDGSKGAEKAIRLAEIYGAPIRLIHVVDGEVVESEEDFRRARDVFTVYANDLAKREGLDGTPCEVRRGSPSAQILDFASGAKCMAIGSHGRGGFRATVIGSVADKVVRGTSVPVFVVPIAGRGDLGPDPIVVGLDGSKRAEAGLEAARELAAATGSSLYLVRAHYFPAPSTVEFGYYAPDLAESVRIGAEEYLQEIAREGESAVTVLGPADSAILESARQLDADLIVLTSHGRGLAGRLALGSTTDRVMHAAERVLLVVPSPPDS